MVGGHRKRATMCSAAVAAALTTTTEALAINRTYVGPANGLWQNDANWSPFGRPQSADNAFIVNNDPTDRSVVMGGLASVSSVSVANTSPNGNTLTIDTDLSLTANAVFLGGDSTGPLGRGTINVQNSLLQVNGTLRIWDTAGTQFNLNNGAVILNNLNTSGNPSRFINGWNSGTLEFRPSAGTVVAIDSTGPLGQNFTLGVNRTLVTRYTHVGANSNGSFTQTGGTHQVTDNDEGLRIGFGAFTGTYSLAGGALISNGDQTIGNTGNAVFNHNLGGGTNTIGLPSVPATMYIGQAAGKTAQYNLGAGGTTTVHGDTVLGNLSGGTATGILNITGGSFTSTGTLRIWDSGSSAVNLSGGSLSVGSIDTDEKPSRFNWTAGTLTFSQSLVLDGDLSLVPFSGLTLSPGKTLVCDGGLTMGPFGGGNVTQTGGSCTTTTLDVGPNPFNNTTYDISAGTLNVLNNATLGDHDFFPGGTGVLSVSGTAVVTIGGTLNVQDGQQTQVNLTGGSLHVRGLNTYGNSSRFNWTAGTLTLTQFPGDFLRIDSTGPLGQNLSLDSDQTLNTHYTHVGVNSNGSLTLNGGMHHVTDVVDPDFAGLLIGWAGYSGTYNLASGALVSDDDQVIGFNGTGTFNHNLGGGTNMVGTPARNADLWIGGLAGATGQYNLGNGGQVTVYGDVVLANGGSNPVTGILNISGGSMNASGVLKIWNRASSAVNLSGGTLTVGSLQTDGNPSRFLGNGTTTGWTGGTLSITGAGGLALSNSGPLGSQLSLGTGKTLNLTHTLSIADAAQLTLSGGTVNAGSVVVGTTPGGAIVAAQSGTINAPISGPGSVIKTTGGTATLNVVSTYTGGTIVLAGTLQTRRLQENNLVFINGGGRIKVLESLPTLPNHPSGSNAVVSRLSSLTIAAGGTLDLTNNDLILDYTGTSPAAAIEALVASGYNGSGDWQGDGITSSVAAADGSYVLAVADNAALPTPFGSTQGGPLFSGMDVDLTTVLIKFTHRVDINLDGVITPDDAAVFGTNFDSSVTSGFTFAMGDVDFDGACTPNDAAIFGTFYDESVASLPEPAALSATSATIAIVARRRPRRVR